MRSVRINVHDKRTDVVDKERNKKDISVVNYISTKQESKREKTNVNICHNSWRVQLSNRMSSKGEPVRMMENPNNNFSYTAC